MKFCLNLQIRIECFFFSFFILRRTLNDNDILVIIIAKNTDLNKIMQFRVDS